MKCSRVRTLVLAAAGIGVVAAPPVFAQTASTPPAAATASAPAHVQQVRDELERLKKEFEVLRQQYDQRITALEQRIGGLAGPSAVAVDPPPASPVAASTPAPVATP